MSVFLNLLDTASDTNVSFVLLHAELKTFYQQLKLWLSVRLCVTKTFWLDLFISLSRARGALILPDEVVSNGAETVSSHCPGVCGHAGCSTCLLVQISQPSQENTGLHHAAPHFCILFVY